MNPQHNLKAYCKSKGITNAQIADKIGVSQSAVNQFLNGKNSATVDTIEKYNTAIAEIAGMDKYELIYDVAFPDLLNGRKYEEPILFKAKKL